MLEMQPKPGGGGLAAAWRTAGPLIAAGLSALAVIVGLSEFVSPVPLLTALVATLVLAAVSVACTPRRRTNVASSARPAFLQFQAQGLALVTIGTSTWLIGRLLSTGTEFYSLRQ